METIPTAARSREVSPALSLRCGAVRGKGAGCHGTHAVAVVMGEDEGGGGGLVVDARRDLNSKGAG